MDFKAWRGTLERGRAAALDWMAAHRTRTYVLALPPDLWAVEARGGKFLRRFRAPLPDSGDGAALAEALTRLKEQGLRGSFLWLVNDPGLRAAVRAFPDMTDEEFAETLYWEQDRFFYGTGAYTLGWRVLRHTPEGYTVFLHGAPQDTLDLWKAAAEKAGLAMGAALAVTDIAPGEPPCFTLYLRRRTAILVYRGRRVETRVVKFAEPGRGALFFRHILETEEMGAVPLYLVPLAGTDEEIRAAWRDWVCGEIKALEAEPPSGGPEEEPAWEDTATPTGGSGFPAVEADGGADNLEENDFSLSPPAHSPQPAAGEGGPRIVLVEPAAEGEPGWAETLALVLHAEGAARIPLSLEEPEEEGRRRPLRLAQGAALLAGLYFLLSAGGYLAARWNYHQGEVALAALAPAGAALEARREEERTAAERTGLVKELEEGNPHWEQKLVALADGLPAGVALDALTADRGAHLVRLTGTSRAEDGPLLLRGRLQQEWGGTARLAKRTRDGKTGRYEFVLEWKRDDGAAAAQGTPPRAGE